MNKDHYVGWHSDKGLNDPNNVVVTVSLGSSRRFSFREKINHNNKITTYLNDGVKQMNYLNIQYLNH